MIEVELPDGNVVEFPEGTAPNVIESALASFAQPAAAPVTQQAPVGQAPVGQAPIGQAPVAQPQPLEQTAPQQAPVGPAPVQPPQPQPDEITFGDDLIRNAEYALVGLGSGFTRLGQGAGQGLLAAGTMLGLVDEATYDDYSSKTLAERRAFDDTDAGKSISGRIYQGIGEYGPQLVAGGGAVSGLTSLGGRLAGAAAAGATSGALQYTDAKEERLVNMAVGAAAGGLAKGVAEFATRGLNRYRKAVEYEFNDDTANVFGKAIVNRGGIDVPDEALLASQVSQEALANTLEATSKGRQNLITLAKKQTQQVRDRVATIASKGDQSSIGGAIEKAHGSAVTTMRKSRNDLWKSGMAEVDKLTNGEAIMKAPSLKKFVATEIDELTNSLASKDKASMLRTLKAFQSSLGDGDLTSKQVSKALVDFTGGGSKVGIFGAKGSQSANKEFADGAKARLMDDINDMADGGGLDQQAATLLKSVRQEYAVASDEISQVTKSALGKLIGRQDNAVIPPEEIYKKLAKLKGTSLTNASRILDKTDPAVMNNVRAQVLADALEVADDPISGLNFKKMTKELSKADPRLVKDSAEINATFKAVQDIATALPDASKTKVLDKGLGEVTGSIREAMRRALLNLSENKGAVSKMITNKENRSVIRKYVNSFDKSTMIGQVSAMLSAHGLFGQDQNVDIQE